MSKSSKSSKPSYEKIVETVENLEHLLSWISTSLTFWNMDSIFPCNLIKKSCDDYYDDLEILLSKNNPSP